MPAPSTVVTLVDEDGDEFPIRLPGVYQTNRAADVAAALQLVYETPEFKPRGVCELRSIEYFNEAS